MNNLSAIFNENTSSLPSFILQINSQGEIIEQKQFKDLLFKKNIFLYIDDLDKDHMKNMIEKCKSYLEIQFEFRLTTNKWMRGILREGNKDAEYHLSAYDITAEKRMVFELKTLALYHSPNPLSSQKESEKNESNRLTLEKDLRFALERDELTLYYQPLVNVIKGKIMGAEALLRWNHPKLGLIPPSEFISILEDTGLIIPIGEWLIQEACIQQRKWVQKGLPPLSMSVNISPIQFKSNILVKAVNDALAYSCLDPSFLKLELTENMIVRNIGQTLEILKELNHIGIGVSIDDFGTGYSSLSYLKKFPIQTIKIDRAFIKEIDYDAQDQAIVKAIIDMARSLKLDIVAEGTETDRQILYLREVGCETVQGYYFSRPVTADEFEKQILQWNQLAERISHQTFIC